METGIDFLNNITNKVVLVKTKDKDILGYFIADSKKIKVRLSISHRWDTNNDEYQAIISLSRKGRSIARWGCLSQDESIDIALSFEKLRNQVNIRHMETQDNKSKRIKAFLNL